jgi:ankyrin repeat protein
MRAAPPWYGNGKAKIKTSGGCMGAFFTNCHVRTSDKSSCVKALKGIVRSRAMITDAKNGWITVYDEGSESQDIEELRRLGQGLSARLKTAVFCFMVHDSDIFVYLLYDKGKFVDQFDSHPDYFGPITAERRKEWAGTFGRLVKFAKRGTTAEKIGKVLAKPQTVEEKRTAQFAALMGIDQGRACVGFKYAQETANSYQILYGRGYSTSQAELVEAVAKRDVSAVRALLGKGVSPNQMDKLGIPILVSAIRYEALEVAESLVAAGADVFAEGKMKGDALWIASAEGHRKILELLLRSAKGDARLPKSLEVAFASAALYGHLEIVRLLLESGADVNKADEKGNTPLMFASIRGVEGEYERRTQRSLLQRPDRPKTDWPKIVETLLQAGANPNLQTKDGISALMGAAARGLEEICILLIRGGADVNLKHSKGMTAADIAQATNHPSVADLLRRVAESGPGATGKE